MARLIPVTAALVVLVLAGCGGGSQPTDSGSATPPPRAAEHQHSGFGPHEGNGPVRAKMVPGLSYTSSTVQWPQNGGWLAETSGETKELFVLAGGDAQSHTPRGDLDHPRNGLIQIMGVTGIGRVHQGNTFKVVHGTGAIRITKAPVGRGLSASVLYGDIRFTSQSGITGTLHLKNNTVTLNQ